MLRKYLSLILAVILVACTQNTLAQTFSIKGKLADADSMTSLPKATIRLVRGTDTARARMIAADEKGDFSITEVRPGVYQLIFSFTGYNDGTRKITISNASIDLGEVLLVKKEKTLNDVTVVGKIPPARQKDDTTEINAAALKVNRDATAEDLLRKAPGITIENGQVTAQGEQVRRVTIDGRQFFGDDATAALRNLPAEVIDKVQVFDRMSDQAQLTGFSDGNEVKAINIVTKANMRNGQFGRMYAGYGTNDRYAAGGSVNIFKKDTRINLIGLFNNVNQQNFSGEDLLGVSGAANQGRGGRGGFGGRGGGGRPGGWGGGGNNFQVGQQPGIATTNAFGVNYSDLWLKRKVEVSGSYFFNQSKVDARSETSRESFLPGDTSQFYNEVNKSANENFNHRVNFRAEYKIDSNNTLIFSPNLSFQKNKSISEELGANRTASDALISSSLNNRRSEGDGYNLRSDLTYRHGFARRGRSVSLGLNTSLNRRDSETYLDALSSYIKTGSLVFDTVRQYTDNYSKSATVSANLAYTEPIGKKGAMIQLNYNPQFTDNKADQRNYQFDKTGQTYSLLDTTLSNVFDNTVTAQNGGVTYRMGDRDNQFSVGVNYQSTRLESAQVFPLKGNIDKTFSNWLPNLSWRKNLTKQSNLRVGYRASLNPPSVNQLQNVINISNPLFVTTGNPDLDQSYTHFMYSRLSSTNTTKGRTFFAGVFAQKVQNYVTNGTWIASKDSLIATDIILRKGNQLSKPVNLDGYWSVRSFVSYGFPLKLVKSNFNLNAGINFVRTPGTVNDVLNFSNNYVYTVGANLASNISEYIDFNLNYSGNFNKVVNSIQSSLNNKYYYHSAGFKINLLTKSGFFILNDVTNQLYSGLADGFNQNFWLWNVSGGKKFLKNQRGEVKVTVFDLLKQNQSVVRNVGETYIEDVQTRVLQQYFMFTFTYTLRNFGQAANRASQERSSLRDRN